MCRPCLLAVRIEEDADWVLHPETARPRDRQLELIIGRRATKAIPLPAVPAAGDTAMPSSGN